MAVACGPVHPDAGHPAVGQRDAWRMVDGAALAGPGSMARVAALASVGGAWEAAGSVADPGGERHVALWSTTRPGGRWTPAPLERVVGGDGGTETLTGVAVQGGTWVAVGSDRSPFEGYARPSTWVAGQVGGPWHEVSEPRELFGGPDIVGVAGLASGRDGFTVAGTWSDPAGRPTAAVWQSADGTTWVRDSTDPAFAADAHRQPLVTSVADGAAGLLVAGVVDRLVPGQAARTEGAVWGRDRVGAWHEVTVASPGGGLRFDAVAATPGGWVVAGRVGAVGAVRPAVWAVDARLHVSGPHLLPGATPTDVPLAVAAGSGRVVVAGVEGAVAVVWRSVGPLQTGAAGGWRADRLTTVPWPVSTVAVASAAGAVLVDVAGVTSSILWWGAG